MAEKIVEIIKSGVRFKVVERKPRKLYGNEDYLKLKPGEVVIDRVILWMKAFQQYFII